MNNYKCYVSISAPQRLASQEALRQRCPEHGHCEGTGMIVLNKIVQPTFRITDVYGTDVTGKVTLEKIDGLRFNLSPTGLISGLYMITVTDGKEIKYNHSFSVVK